MSMPSVLESGLRSRQKQYWGICASSADCWLFLAGTLLKDVFQGLETLGSLRLISISLLELTLSILAS